MPLLVGEEVEALASWPPPPGSGRRSLESLPRAFIRLRFIVRWCSWYVNCAAEGYFFSFKAVNSDARFISIQIVNLLTSQSGHVPIQWTSQIAVTVTFPWRWLLPLAESFSWSDCFSWASDVCAQILKTPPRPPSVIAHLIGRLPAFELNRCYSAIVLLSSLVLRLQLLILKAAICVRNRPWNAFVRSESETNYQSSRSFVAP